MANDKEGSPETDHVRRRFLKAAAVGGTTILAGCSGGGNTPEPGGGEGTTTESGRDEPTGEDNGTAGGNQTGDGGDVNRLDRTFRIIPTNFNPTDLQYNFLNPTNWAQPVQHHIWDRWLWYMPSAQEYRPGVFSEWSFDGDTLTAQIDEEQTWHDGDPVTAEDVVGHWQLLIGQSMFVQGRHPYFSSVEATGEHTVEFTMHEPFNQDLVLQSEFHGDDARLFLKPSLFSEWMGDVKTAVENGNSGTATQGGDTGTSDQSELRSLYSELQSVTVDEAVGSYYTKQAQVENQFYRTETFDEYARADNINWTENRFVARASQQAMINEITAGNVDATPQFSIQNPSIMEQWPEDRIRVEVPTYGGRSIIFNHNNVPRPIRRAVAWVVDPQALIDGLPPNFTTIVNPPAGMNQSATEEWLGSVASAYHSYKHDPDRATTILENADYTMDGDTWITPDGEPIELVFTSPPWADSAAPFAQIVGDNLNEFGLTTEVQVKDGATWTNDLTTGNYDLSLTGWGGPPHPFFFLQNTFSGAHAGYSKIADRNQVEVPPIGEWDGEPETVRPPEILANLRTIDSDEEMRSGIQQLAWIVNYNMTLYTVIESFSSPFLLHPDRFNYTTDEDEILQNRNPLWDLQRYGQLQAVE